MKLPEMPASIKTQLAAYDSTIADASQKLAEAQVARKTMLDEFDGLLGKLVRVTTESRKTGPRVKHFRVAMIGYDASGTVSFLKGPTVKANGEQARNHSGVLYRSDVRHGNWQVVSDVDA
jgi:hypothetical protein